MGAAALRRWHSYIGLFIAPSVLFFSLTGALQLFGLHEAHGTYQPSAFIEKLSTVHKDQKFALGDHHGPSPEEKAPAQPADPAAKRPAQEDDDAANVPTLLLKIVFLVVAVGLTISAALGLWIGLTQTRKKAPAWILVIAGTLTPIVLLVF